MGDDGVVRGRVRCVGGNGVRGKRGGEGWGVGEGQSMLGKASQEEKEEEENHFEEIISGKR